jgi:hypothetical protein
MTDKNAKKIYGIEAKYYTMPNREKRFSLNCSNDGSAYIRTQADKGAKGWQTSHYHRGLSETYIVQKGSIIYAEFVDNEIFTRRYVTGEMFTTKKKIPHNVYMMENTVIHTVKHGETEKHPRKNADWWEDGEGCEELNELKKQEIDQILDKHSLKKNERPEISGKQNIIVLEKKEPRFTTTYMHFDNLIWMIPAWIFGLLGIGIAIMELSPRISFFNKNIFLSVKTSDIILFGFLIMEVILSYTMYKFRYHQMLEKREIKSSKSISPQILIQIFLNVFFCVLLSMCLNFWGKETETVCFFIFFVVIAVIVAVIPELILLYFVKKNKKKNDYTVS